MKNVLLVGLGRFGMGVAEKLHQLRHQVMAVDRSEERINAVLDLVTEAQIGDSTDQSFLRSLGVEDFDVCIVTIGEDFQSSLETTSLLKEMGAKLVVARACQDEQEKFLLRNGADRVVYPEKQLAAWTALRYTTDGLLDLIELDRDHSIYELMVPPAWSGRTVGELDIRKRFGLNILGVRSDGELSMAVGSETPLLEGQSILVVGKNDEIQKYLRAQS